MDSDEESLNSEDAMGGLESKVLDRENKDYEYQFLEGKSH